MRVLLAGATGTMGRAVLAELGRRQIPVVALVRSKSAPLGALPASTILVTVDDLRAREWVKEARDCDVVISCLASRSGAPKDAERVDFDANRQLLQVAEALGIRRFVLLSAICVQKPRLAFQRQKLRFEALLGASSVPATIVRPTAFFKSLSGQIERVRAGKPFLVFGGGELTACKPISERDLATFMVDQVEDDTTESRCLPIGGPGPALTPLDQARLLGELLGKPCAVRSLPPQMFDWMRWAIQPLGLISSWAAERVEFLRIAKYYATESMLSWDARRACYDAEATPEFGADTLAAFYARVLSGEEATPERGEQTLF